MNITCNSIDWDDVNPDGNYCWTFSYVTHQNNSTISHYTANKTCEYMNLLRIRTAILNYSHIIMFNCNLILRQIHVLYGKIRDHLSPIAYIGLKRIPHKYCLSSFRIYVKLREIGDIVRGRRWCQSIFNFCIVNKWYSVLFCRLTLTH